MKPKFSQPTESFSSQPTKSATPTYIPEANAKRKGKLSDLESLTRHFSLKSLSLLAIIMALVSTILLLGSTRALAGDPPTVDLIGLDYVKISSISTFWDSDKNNRLTGFPGYSSETQLQENIGSTDVVTFTVYLPLIFSSPVGWQAPQTSGTTNLLDGVGCSPNDDNICTAGGPGLSLYTSNGGSNWTSVTANLSGVTLYDVSCATATKCVAVGKSTSSNGIILVSNNGGQSWSSSFNQSYQMNAVDCALSNQCVAVGTDSEARYTFDGGVSWQTGRLGNTSLYGIDCFGNRNCWMVGDGGRVIGVYPNAGGPDGIGVIEKKDLFLSPVRTLLAIGCSGTDGQHCVAVGESGVVAKTTNRGGSWSKPSSGTTVNLNGVSCPTASDCYAVGNGGTLLISKDGGTSWSPEPSPTSQNLKSIYCFTGSSSCFAVGANGTILRRY